MAQETDSERIARWEREIERLRAETERLRRALEEALRAAQRQAAPFSRRHPQANPEKPGRKAGEDYGRAHRREAPVVVDEVVEVPLPTHCPHCGGGVEETGVVAQYQTEIPEPPRIRSHQLAGRTSHPPEGGPAPGLGRKPHGDRSPRAKHLAQYPANLPPAEPARAAAAPPVFPPTTGVGFDAARPPFTLN